MSKSFKISTLFPVDLIVDVNEEIHSKNLFEELKRLGIKIAVLKLEAGDYLIPAENGAGILIERKRDEDFISSIIDSRLWSQAELLSKASKEKGLISVLLIEGDLWKAIKERGISETAVIRSIDEIAIDFRIPIIYTSGPKSTASWIAAKIKSINRKRGKEKFLPYVRKKARSDSERILNSLAILTGYETARKLLLKYRTLKNVYSCTIEDLMSIEGIGETRARKIFTLFNLSYEEKNNAEARGEER
ncbi:MAG: ERCC4 domain-containing protein [Fervidicoccaceae archaeon]